ncbi:MAG TPA: RNA methyltransferase [Sporosarcina sp.]|nr:RNA methyltransferase [Sporosarcina sp.]
MKRIESIQNSFVKHWKKLVLNRKDRDKAKEFIVEGFHLVEDALKAEQSVVTIMKREDVELPATWEVDGVSIIEITKQVAKEISETEQSQGVYAHCKQQQRQENEYAQWETLLWIDAVQDPGNVGTMIRTADAAGIDAVIIGKGSADPYNPKTVRSAQGSHFHIPIVKADLLDWVEIAKRQHIQLIGTSLEQSVHYQEVAPKEKFALIMGNEGSGLQPELLKRTDVNVLIPIHGQAESLNVAVATGILLYAYV